MVADSSQTPYSIYIEYNTLNKVLNKIKNSTKDLVLSNFFISMENSASVINQFTKDTRVAFDKNEAIQLINSQLIDQFDFLSRYFNLSTTKFESVKKFSDINFYSKMNNIFLMPDKLLDYFLHHYNLISKDFPFYIGFEKKLKNLEDKPIFNYNQIHPFTELHEKNLKHNIFVEDYLFCIVHQIIENWLNIFYFFTEEVKLDLNKLDYIKCKEKICILSLILLIMSKTMHLLEFMIHADYHPLRVSLRDASGAQSEKASNLMKQVFFLTTLFESNIKEKYQLTFLKLLQYHENFPEIYKCFSALMRLVKNCRSFFSNHFFLASNTIGQNTIGSLGMEVKNMASHFLQPLSPNLEQALYDFTVLTNFKYSQSSGKTIFSKEKEVYQNKYHFSRNTSLLSKNQMKIIALNYLDELQNKRTNNWLKLFDPEKCMFKEHLKSKPYIGLQKISVFIHTFVSTMKELNYKIEKEEYGEDNVKIFWLVDCTMYNDCKISFSGYDKLFFNSEYQIQLVESEWDSDDVYNQLIQQFNNTASPNKNAI